MRGRILFLGLMMILLSGGVIGCAADKEETVPDTRMKITIGVWDAEKALAGDPVLAAIEERFNVTFVPVNMTWNDYYEKIERWAATDSLPDLFVGDFRNSLHYFQWIQKGLLSAIPKDLSAYPYLQQYIAELAEEELSLADGEMYCIPRLTYPSQAWTSIDRIIAYRWDLAQAAGITEEPETWEEFQEMMLAIIREDPEGTGIQGLTSGSLDQVSGLLLPYASSIAVADGTQFFWKLDGDGLYRPVYFTDDLIPAFQLGRELYTSGVIEQDAVMQTVNSSQDKFLRGESAALLYSGGFGGVYGSLGIPWEEYHGRDFLEDVKALGLMQDKNGNKAYPIWGYAWSESYISDKVDDEKRDRILQIYDYLLSDEGAFLGTYGPEGDLYEVVGGRVEMHDPEVYVAGKYPSCGVFATLVRWDSSLYDERFPDTIPSAYKERDLELMREAETVPIPAYEPRCSSIMKESQIDFTIQVGGDFVRIMTGSEPVEEMWEEIRQEYEEAGLEDVIRIVNERMREEP